MNLHHGTHKFIIILLLVIINLIIADIHIFFKDSTYIPAGYETSSHPMQMFILDLGMYLNYSLYSLVIVICVSKKELALYLLAWANFLYWTIDVCDFVFYNNYSYLNIKDYVVAISSLLFVTYGVKTYKTKSGNTETIINVTNLALLKWFIPKSEAEKALKASQRNIEIEHKLLRTQLNPHFLFNSLTSIQNYIYNENPETAANYLGKFAKLMRLIIENSREEYVLFTKELETLKLYLELQKLRFNDKFEFEIIVDPLIDQEEISVPPMFAQPFIENSLEHGILHQEQHGKITIRFALNGDKIFFEVEDNGVGREKASLINSTLRPEHKSLASKITEERLSILHNSTSTHNMINMEDIKNPQNGVMGTKVGFCFPYKYS